MFNKRLATKINITLCDQIYLSECTEFLKKFITRNKNIKNIIKKINNYNSIKLMSYDVDLLRYPFLKFLILKFFSKEIFFSDTIKEKRVSFIEIFFNYINQFIKFPIFLYKTQRKISKIGKILDKKRKQYKYNNQIFKQVYYLRTDFWFGLKSGGSVAHAKGVIEAFQNLGIEVNVFSNDRFKYLDPSIKVEVVKPKMFFRDFPELPELEYNQQLLRYLLNYIQKNGKPDFIYQRYSLNNYVGLELSYILGLPFILEYNGSFLWMSNNWSRGLIFKKLTERIEYLNLKYADLIVVVSKAMFDELVERGITPDKILINPNGVDPKKYNPELNALEISQKYNLTNDIVIGFIGTFSQWHGVVEMAKAIIRFYEKYKEEKVKFLLIGEGPLLAKVEEIINQSKYKNLVIFTGIVEQNEAPKYLAACDIFLSPHVPNPDGSKFFGSPTKLFEYMAMGRAIIASDLEQIGEILKHKKTGYLVTPGDVEELVEAINVLVKNKNLRLTLGKNARKEVIAKYTWEKHVERILEKLELLAKKIKYYE